MREEDAVTPSHESERVVGPDVSQDKTGAVRTPAVVACGALRY